MGIEQIAVCDKCYQEFRRPQDYGTLKLSGGEQLQAIHPTLHFDREIILCSRCTYCFGQWLNNERDCKHKGNESVEMGEKQKIDEINKMQVEMSKEDLDKLEEMRKNLESGKHVELTPEFQRLLNQVMESCR